MKNLLFTLLCLSAKIYAEETPTIQGKITAVTMYRQSAKMSGIASASVQKGVQELIITGVANNIVQPSLQVTLKAAGVQLLSTTYRTNNVKQEKVVKEIKELLDSVKLLAKQHELINDKIKTVEDQERAIKMLIENHLGGDKGVSLEEVQRVDDYYQKRLPEVRTRLRELQEQQEKSILVLARMNEKMTLLDPKTIKTVGELVLQLKADAPAKVDIGFTMLTKSAYWVPVYDVKTLDLNKSLALAYKANIVQYSGIAWENVKLLVSTGNPSANNQQPKLQPRYASVLRLSPEELLKDSDSDGVPDKLDRENNTPNDCPVDTRGVALDSDGDGVKDCDDREPYTAPGYPVDPNGVATKLLSSIYTTSQIVKLDDIVTYRYKDRSGVSFTQPPPPPPPGDAGVSVELEVKDLQNIPTDGQAHLILIDNYEIPAIYEYNVVPRKEQSAFLLAKIPNFEQYNLVEGAANLFFGDVYVGQSVLNPNSLNDTLLLSFGRDEKIAVKCEKLKEFSTSKFLSTTRKQTYGVEVTLKNNKLTAADIEVTDNIPISKNQEVIVEVEEQSGAKYQVELGKFTWDIHLNAGESKKIRLIYNLKYPKNQQIIVGQ